MSRVLIVNDGKRERELLLVERLVVGRDPACDVSFDDGLLSRRHAEFVAASSAVTVRDLGSRNGIFVNGTRRVEQTLKPGDVVQIGPLRVRYQLDHAAGSEAPARMDADGTMMIPAAPPESAAPAAPAPMATSFDTFRGPAPPPPADIDDELEGETRFINGAELAMAAHSQAAAGDDATTFTPTPRPGASPLAAIVSPASPAAAARPAGDARAGDPLGSFILVQLGSLAFVVFVVTVAPLFLSRGAVISALADGSLVALLVWPFLPLVFSLAATLVFAHVVNQRVLEVLDSEARGGEKR